MCGIIPSVIAYFYFAISQEKNAFIHALSPGGEVVQTNAGGGSSWVTQEEQEAKEMASKHDFMGRGIALRVLRHVKALT